MKQEKQRVQEYQRCVEDVWVLFATHVHGLYGCTTPIDEIGNSPFSVQILGMVYQHLFLAVVFPEEITTMQQVYSEYLENNIGGETLWSVHQDRIQGVIENRIQGNFFGHIVPTTYTMSNAGLVCCLQKIIDVSIRYPILIEYIASIHENLLAKHLCYDTDHGYTLVHSALRTNTGAFYSPQTLIDLSIQETLVPILQTIHSMEQLEQQVASLRICDPACGAGVFLLSVYQCIMAYANTLIDRGGCIDTKDTLERIAESIVRCAVYGVDITPISAQLASVCLWRLAPWVPLRDIEKHVCSGNAVLGMHFGHAHGCIQQGIRLDYLSTFKHQTDAIHIASVSKKLQKRYTKEHMPHETIDVLDEKYSNMLVASMLWPRESHLVHLCPVDYRDIGTEATLHIANIIDTYAVFHWHLRFSEVYAQGGFDIILGNPPYLDAENLTKYQPYERHALQQLYHSAKGNWDLYVLFVELAVELLRPGGVLGLITPNKLIASEYAGTVQQLYIVPNTIRTIVDYSQIKAFRAATVSVIVSVIEKTPMHPNHEISFVQYTDIDSYTTQRVKQQALCTLPRGFLSFPFVTSDPQIWELLQLPNTLQDIATISDGASTKEAYDIAKHIRQGSLEDLYDSQKIKLINTGTIDPDTILWGKKKIVYLGCVCDCPIIDADILKQIAPKRHKQAMNQKIAIGGMGKRLEAVVVPVGFVCGKSTVVIELLENSGVDIEKLAKLLNSDLYSQLYCALFGWRGFSKNGMTIGARQVEQLPIDQCVLQIHG